MNYVMTSSLYVSGINSYNGIWCKESYISAYVANLGKGLQLAWIVIQF
jgi:hypothetical protein